MISQKIIVTVGLAAIFAYSAASQSVPDASNAHECSATVFDDWDAGGGTEVSIDNCGDDTPCGTITKLSDPDLPDGNNQDSSLQSRPLIGVQMLFGFRKSRNGWHRGRIYNPANGKTYSSSIRLQTNGQLLVKGCIGPFCESQIWTRVSGEVCHN